MRSDSPTIPSALNLHKREIQIHRGLFLRFENVFYENQLAFSILNA